MHVILKKLCLIALCAGLGACAAGGRPFVKAEPPAANEARVYVYRPAHLQQSGTYPTVSLDGKPVGGLKNGGFLALSMPAGDHVFTFDGGFLQWGHRARDYQFTVAGGAVHYYKLDPSMNGDGNRIRFGYGFGPVSEATARAEMQGLNESQ